MTSTVIMMVLALLCVLCYVGVIVADGPALTLHGMKSRTNTPPVATLQDKLLRKQKPVGKHDLPPIKHMSDPACASRPYKFGGDYDYCHANYPTSNSYTIPAGYNLVNVQLVTRHGDRAPVNILPHNDQAFNFCNQPQTIGIANFPQRKKRAAANEGRRLARTPITQQTSSANPFASQFWQGNCMQGQLSSIGIEQLYGIGQSLRDIYVNKLQFLPSQYNAYNNSMYVRSTDVWRTQQSAESLLSGLYPTNTGAEDLIPIFNYPSQVETMYANPTACPALGNVMAEQRKAAPWVNHLNNPPLWNTLDSILDTANASADWHQTFDHYYDNFHVRQCHQLPLPCSQTDRSKCITPDVAAQVTQLCDWEYAYLFTQAQWLPMAQLGIGGFMSVIRDVIVATVTGNPSISTIGTPSFAYYSGHDTTIAAVLGALNVTGWRWPPYASQILFELWAKQGPNPSYAVRFIYNGDVIPLQALGCCDALCPVENVVEWLNMVVPDNLADICSKPAKH